MASVYFENILTGERVMVSRENHGDLARSVAAAYVNSGDLSVNKQEDHGWRLIPEQMAIVRAWMKSDEKAQEVSQALSVPIEDLRIHDFVAYLINSETAEDAKAVRTDDTLRQAEDVYRQRIEALEQGTPVETPAVKPVVVAKKK